MLQSVSSNSPHPTLVSREQMEHLWASLRASTADPRAGIFGPASLSWKVNREAALFLGAGRAALLQLAHPWVAVALDQHSSLRSDPLARFHNTFRVVFTMIFGTLEQALAASRHLHSLHTRIEGQLPTAVAAYERGSSYHANDLAALIWVYATLVESALIAYATVLPALAAAEREAYYAESKSLAALFGIPSSALPADWPAFEAYVRAMCSSGKLGVNALSRELAQGVLHGHGSRVPIPAWYRSLTAAWLPEPLRADFALRFGEPEQQAVRSASAWLPRVYRRLPSLVRFIGPYHEAQARLEGLPTARLTALSNRFWMGRPRMMFCDPESE